MACSVLYGLFSTSHHFRVFKPEEVRDMVRVSFSCGRPAGAAAPFHGDDRSLRASCARVIVAAFLPATTWCAAFTAGLRSTDVLGASTCVALFGSVCSCLANPIRS
ncbi:unnamed protein product, partial [Ceratitis capitata]